MVRWKTFFRLGDNDGGLIHQSLEDEDVSQAVCQCENRRYTSVYHAKANAKKVESAKNVPQLFDALMTVIWKAAATEESGK
jgi:hypothetical protein